MASSASVVAFMLRCRQASRPTSCNVYLRKPHPNLQLLRQPVRCSSKSSQGLAAEPSTPPHQSPFPSQRSSNSPPSQTRAAHSSTLWTALKSLFGFKPKPFTPSRINALNNPYRARKKWPPDFRTLHPKHQFHFEKTFRRRLKLKYLRPRWIKGTKVVQFGLMTGIVLYWIFFLQVEGKEGTVWDAVSI